MKTSPSEYLQKPMKSPLSADDVEVALGAYKRALDAIMLLDEHDPDDMRMAKPIAKETLDYVATHTETTEPKLETKS